MAVIKLPFPILEELRRDGMTDYAARLVRYDTNSPDNSTLQGVFFSCATDNPAGFDTRQLQQMRELLPHFAIAIKSRLTYEVASTVTKTYLGKDAGRRVLTGEIERGSNPDHQSSYMVFRSTGIHKPCRNNSGQTR